MLFIKYFFFIFITKKNNFYCTTTIKTSRTFRTNPQINYM